jgi:hypothetical protein
MTQVKTQIRLMLEEGDILLSADAVARGAKLRGALVAAKPFNLITFLNKHLPEGADIPAEFAEVSVTAGEVVIDTVTNEYVFSLTTSARLNLAELAELEIRKIDFSYSRDAGNGKGTWMLKSEGALRCWKVAAETYRINIDGTLEMTIAEKSSLTFKAAEGGTSFRFPTLLPGQNQENVELEFGLTEIGLFHEKNDKGSDWSFSSTFGLKLHHLHETVASCLPPSFLSTLKIDNQGISVSLQEAVRYEFDLPQLTVQDKPAIPLGKAFLNLSELAFALGKEITVSAVAGIGIPSGLNNIFGVDAGQKPLVKLFKVYDEADKENSLMKFKFTAGTEGVKLLLVSSPFEAVKFVEEGGASWCYINLGDYGEIKFKVPEFSLDTQSGGFKASGGFQVVRPLSLPLGLFKQFLTSCNAEKAASILPDKLPLQSINIIDENNNFRVDEFMNLATGAGINIPENMKGFISELGKRMDKLPDGLKKFLNVKIPDGLTFDIVITPDGGVRFDVSVPEGSEPIRLLFPTPSPLPSLQGITLRSISFGEILAGNFFILQLDADFEQFDLSGIAAALLLPENTGLPLPDTRRLHTKLIVEKLFMIIDYKTIASVSGIPVPIPVPVFYNRLGVEYYGLQGLEMQTHIAFPMPKFSFSDLKKVFFNLIKFFSDKKYLLNPEEAPKDLDLKFLMEDNYIRLPDYLGGEMLGSKGKNVEISLYKSVAMLMNGIKTLSLDKVIQAMPLELRTGNTQASFAGLSANVQWVITTPAEFRDVAYKNISASPGQVNALMQVLPAYDPSIDQGQGLVVFLRGNTSLGNVANLETVFGLAASDASGFNTGFRFAGNVSGMFDLEAKGALMIARSPEGHPARFSANGSAYLELAGNRMFDGQISASNTAFGLNGKLNLFPEVSPLKVYGEVEGSINTEKVYLHGNVTAQLAGIVLANATATINNQLVQVEGEWLGQRLSLSLAKEEQLVKLSGNANVNLFDLQVNAYVQAWSDGRVTASGSIAPLNIGNVFILSGSEGQINPSATFHFAGSGTPSLTVNGTASLLGITNSVNIQTGESGFYFKTSGILFNTFATTLEVSGSSLANADNILVKGSFNDGGFIPYLKEKISGFIRERSDADTANLNGAITKVQQARTEVSRLDGQINEVRNTISNERSGAKGKFDAARADLDNKQNDVNGLLGQIRGKEAERDRIRNDGYWWGLKGAQIWIYNDKAALFKIGILQTEITALYVAYGTATAALEVAKKAVEITGSLVDNTPYELDPRLSSLLIAKKAADDVLWLAEEALKTLRDICGGIAHVAEFITQHTLGNLLEVKSATFTTQPGAGSNGIIRLSLHLRFMQSDLHLEPEFNFNDPVASASGIAQAILKSQGLIK